MAQDPDELDAFTLINATSQTDRDLAAMLFAETSPPPAEKIETLSGEEVLAAEAAAEEAPPKPGLLARLKTLFRRSKPAATEGEEESPPIAEVVEEPPVEPASDEAEGGEKPAGSRMKIAVIALAVLALLGIGIGGTVLVMQRMEDAKQAEWAKKEAALAAEKAQLEKQKAELAAQKALAEKEAAAKAAAQTETSATGAVAGKPSPDAGDVDCAVVGKENAAQTIKRCIEAYNRATGRTK